MAQHTAEIKRGALLAERYRVLRPLGTGGMATVFLAEDQRLGREVAVKRLSSDAPEDAPLRFDREARMGASLNHPNLVSIFDTVQDAEGTLIVMEYVPGRTLSELADGKPVAPEQAVPILRGVAEALDHVHAEGVVHRDIKPGNVLVRDDGTVKLADLGIARQTDATQITREGQVVGTLPYMAPERRERPGAGGPESDVFALAAMAYELLTGRPPGRDPDLRRDWAEAPPAAGTVIERGLHPDPQQRQPSAGRLIADLEEALGATGERSATTATVPFDPGIARGNGRAPAATSAGSRRGIPRLAAIAGLALLGLALLVAVISGTGGGDDGGGGGEQAADRQVAEPPAEEPAPAPAPEPAPAPAEPTSGGSADAAALNDEGFALIGQGRYDEAIPILEQAVAASEGGGGLTYAYALFNLGNALRLAGRPEEAIPILEQRLEIPNQQDEVARELELAREQAGQGGDGGGEEGD